MKIAVLVKQVPDTETRIRMSSNNKELDESSFKWVINPYDEYAIEEAIKLKEKVGGEVVVISLGPLRVTEVIRSALAMGADRGIRIDATNIQLDNYLCAKILSKIISREKFEIVFGGKRAIDDEASTTILYIAEMLGWPGVGVVDKFELRGDLAIVGSPGKGNSKEVFEVKLPAVFGCEKDLNRPRYATLPGIIKAKSKSIDEVKALDLISNHNPMVTLINYEFPEERKAVRKISGEPEYLAEELVRFLKEEVKVNLRSSFDSLRMNG